MIKKYIDIIYDKSFSEFGFHGAREKDVREILENNEDIMAHFYLVTNKSRDLERKLFESKLASSLVNSMFSTNAYFSWNGKRFIMEKYPSLLIAVNKGEYPFFVSKDDSDWYLSKQYGDLEVAGSMLIPVNFLENI